VNVCPRQCVENLLLIWGRFGYVGDAQSLGEMLNRLKLLAVGELLACCEGLCCCVFHALIVAQVLQFVNP